MAEQQQKANPSRIPGPTRYCSPDGKTTTFSYEEVVYNSFKVETGPFIPSEGSTQALQNILARLQLLEENRAVYNFGLSSPVSPRLFSATFSPDAQSLMPVTEVNDEFYDLCFTKATEDLQAAEAEVERNKKINTCIEENLRQMRAGAGSVFDDFLEKVVALGIQTALQELNEVLPEYAQLNAVYDPETNSLTSLSVGDITINPEQQTFTYNGEVFSSLVSSGLNSVNSQLPSFAQISTSDLGLSLNNVTVSYDSLIELDSESLTPKPEQQLGEGIFVSSDSAGTIQVRLGSDGYDIGKVATGIGGVIVGNVFEEGTSALNSQLPDYFQVSASSSLSIENGQLSYSLESLAAGPLSYNPETGAFVVDDTAIAGELTEFVGTLTSQLPAPLGSLAQLTWEALDPGQLISDLLTGLGVPTTTQNELEDTYSRAKSICENKYKPVTPGAFYTPVEEPQQTSTQPVSIPVVPFQEPQ